MSTELIFRYLEHIFQVLTILNTYSSKFDQHAKIK